MRVNGTDGITPPPRPGHVPWRELSRAAGDALSSGKSNCGLADEGRVRRRDRPQSLDGGVNLQIYDTSNDRGPPAPAAPDLVYGIPATATVQRLRCIEHRSGYVVVGKRLLHRRSTSRPPQRTRGPQTPSAAPNGTPAPSSASTMEVLASVATVPRQPTRPRAMIVTRTPHGDQAADVSDTARASQYGPAGPGTGDPSHGARSPPRLPARRDRWVVGARVLDASGHVETLLRAPQCGRRPLVIAHRIRRRRFMLPHRTGGLTTDRTRADE